MTDREFTVNGLTKKLLKGWDSGRGTKPGSRLELGSLDPAPEMGSFQGLGGGRKGNPSFLGKADNPGRQGNR